MLFDCLCGSNSKKHDLISKQSKYYKDIMETLKEQQIRILQLIYDDLASRHRSKLLTMQNFLVFFNLTGLWGAKLFHQFDKDRKELISAEEFLFGMSKTAKAPFQSKIKLLFNFFEGNSQTGIAYRQFIKMLYNFSKDQLKQILLEDGVFVQEHIIPPEKIKQITEQGLQTMGRRNSSHIFLDYKQSLNNIKRRNQFEEAYQRMIQGYKDPGTCIQFKANNRTYHMKYCNMILLVRQFASHVYSKYGIEQKGGKLSQKQFSQWIKLHMKLFEHYFAAFHLDLWGYCNSQPNYLEQNKIIKSSEGKILNKNSMNKAFLMLVQDVLIICQSKKKMRTPLKIICLMGLNVNKKNDQNGFGMEVSHISDNYQNSTIYFQKEKQQWEWLQLLKIYDGDVLQKKYTVLQMVGTGKFSIVYRCQQKSTKKFYALKVIETTNLPEQAKLLISNESHIMKVVNYPQIICYKETLSTRTTINLILELVEGQDLFQLVRKRGSIEQHECAFVIGQIIKAVMHLHQLDIIHRDLKPENIMVTFNQPEEHVDKSPGDSPQIKQPGKYSYSENRFRKANSESCREISNVKIIDFGLANHISQLQNLPKKNLMVGTPNYMAPQTLLGENPDFKIDNFAIGSILYFMLRGRLAFASQNSEEVLIKTVRGDYSLEDQKWDEISDEAKNLVQRLLEPQPAERIQLDEALNHPWFRKSSHRGIHIENIKIEEKDLTESPKIKHLYKIQKRVQGVNSTLNNELIPEMTPKDKRPIFSSLIRNRRASIDGKVVQIQKPKHARDFIKQ